MRAVRTFRLALAGVAVLALGGCYADDPYVYCAGSGCDDYYGPGPGPGPDGGGGNYCAAGIGSGDIDTGSTLDLDPGSGAGVTAEYLGEGAWRFATACDTAYSGYACHWDLLVTALEGNILGFAPEGLERNDVLDWGSSPDGDAARLIASNDYDLDAFTLDATPGATLSVDVLLDDQCGGTLLSFLEHGRVVQANTQITDLTPTAP
jgi:hypothetical protein